MIPGTDSDLATKVEKMAYHMHDRLTQQRGVEGELQDQVSKLDCRVNAADTAHNLLQEAHSDLETRFQNLISTLSLSLSGGGAAKQSARIVEPVEVRVHVVHGLNGKTIADLKAVVKKASGACFRH
jgi:hypothetical protein